jgi:hypothetical protein
MTLHYFPDTPANVCAAIRDVIDNFYDYEDEGTEKINKAKRVLVDYLSDADKKLFRAVINPDHIGICPAGLDGKGNTIGVRMLIDMGQPYDAWFNTDESDALKDTTIHFYANTLGENFIVYLTGPKAMQTLAFHPDAVTEMDWVLYPKFF